MNNLSRSYNQVNTHIMILEQLLWEIIIHLRKKMVNINERLADLLSSQNVTHYTDLAVMNCGDNYCVWSEHS